MSTAMMNVKNAQCGVISPQELYTLEALKERLGIGNSTLRAARRAGLTVHRKHGRGFVLGADWIEYICRTAAESAKEACCEKAL